jgi:hypothetical protein
LVHEQVIDNEYVLELIIYHQLKNNLHTSKAKQFLFLFNWQLIDGNLTPTMN